MFPERYQQLAEDEIKRLSWDGEPKSLYEPIQYILSLGGKRIRPVLTLLGCALFEDNIEPAIAPAVAMEIFHNFTLIHDDLMDHADLRRGQPTVHKRWNESTAVLSGDAMLVLAYEKLIEGMEPSMIPEAIRVFSLAARKVCEGQQLDMEFETQSDISIDEYLNMISLKTAALLACCLEMGALAGGAKESQRRALHEIGINLGIAFQIEDDILDSFGTETGFGKKIGGDIAANKKTFLALTAFELAAPADRQALQKLYSKTHPEAQEKLQGVLDIYHRYNVKEAAEKARDGYFGQALAQLDSLEAAPAAKEELRSLANTLIRRDR
jgi:geranylgeranyl diphosphate synthase, type II